MLRDKKHYEQMLAQNPTATIGHLLAAKMVLAASGAMEFHGDYRDRLANTSRRLHREYGEVLTQDEVLAEMNQAEEAYGAQFGRDRP